MNRAGLILIVGLICGAAATAQNAADGSFRLALPNHKGQLTWHADGFKIVQVSAKPGGREIGIRGRDQSGRLVFLGFLFLFPEQAPLTSTKCREGVLEPARKDSPTLKILATSERAVAGSPPISLVTYSAQGRDGKPVYSVRGFIATGDICGDLEVYSKSAIMADDPAVKAIIESYGFEQNYSPQLDSVLFYAQTLYQGGMYKDAAPIFEEALVKIKDNPKMAAKMFGDTKTAERVVTDQAGMSYGMSGEIEEARALLEKAIVEDRDYPMYYYNLACADAEEKNLDGARRHLQQAFARKVNVIAGEAMPDPTKDASFLPYRDNTEFWSFLQTLRP
ncbi:MAG: tetratricopeptide repeat protein [Terriglobales bacterium]